MAYDLPPHMIVVVISDKKGQCAGLRAYAPGELLQAEAYAQAWKDLNPHCYVVVDTVPVERPIG